MSQAPQAYAGKTFEKAGQYLAHLDAQSAAELITAASDVVLVLDKDGVIRDMALASEDMLGLGCQQWLGKAWTDTVTVESKPKIEALLKNPEDASGEGLRWRHVNHPVADKPDLALSYSVVQLHSPQGESDTAHAVAFGRDLRSQAALQQRLVTAQLSMERDYWRLRQVETRYRLLFQMASEPVLILEGSIDKLEEANPAAYELFGEKARAPGWNLAASLDAASHSALREMLDRLRASGKADPCEVRLIDGAQDLIVAASQFRQENTLHFLLRFTRPQDSLAPSLARGKQRLLQVMESAPDALVVTDMEGRVLSANRAFLDMGQLGTEDQARGEVLDKWLGRTGVDFRVLLTNLRQHGTVRLFASQMRGEYGSTSEVEISAVAVNSGPQRCLGFTIRD
ncbi:MAG: transcriptional regulator PpsR, partial [Hydrogenophaga sp.]